MQHVVNKLSFDIACADEPQALKVRKDVAQEYFNDMVTIMETCCSLVSDEQTWMQIDKLEIDLPVIKQDVLGKTYFIDLFKEAFERELQKRIMTAPARKTKQQLQSDMLFHFLKTGSLPWWASEKEVDIAEWCKNIMSQGASNDFISRLSGNRVLPQVWERIADQLEAPFGNFIMAAIPALSTMREKMVMLFNEIKQTQPGVLSTEEPMDEIVNNIILKRGGKILNEPGMKPEDLLTPYLFATLSQKVFEQVPARFKSLATNMENPMTLERIEIKHGLDNGEQMVEKKWKVMNGGIVLLSVFLKKFYENLSLWKDDSWATEEAQTKAVYLLYYLGSGEQMPYEYQLTLEKIICGFPLLQPLNKKINLNETEISEANNLLHSVIQHWAALKNTSIAGLRAAFFNRDGLLSQKGDRWLLQVERKTMDVLLDQLPWGYSTISLPWNKYIIYTEW